MFIFKTGNMYNILLIFIRRMLYEKLSPPPAKSGYAGLPSAAFNPVNFEH